MLRIGSRGSRLALWQAGFVKGLIEKIFLEIDVEIITIRTTGDKILETPLFQVGGKGLFVKEIEETLLDGGIDVAVHSMKDMPILIPDGLTIGAVAEREDPRDALISGEGTPFKELPGGAKVGTSSLRRQVQLLNLRPDLDIEPIRGNVDTRLRKLRTEGLKGIVLAVAGLKRMGFQEEITEIFSVDAMIPAVGQGVIALECREGDEKVLEVLSHLNHRETMIAVSSERAFLKKMSGSCQVPIACYARFQKDSTKLKLSGMVASLDGKKMVREEIEGDLEYYGALGEDLAEIILQKGGKGILNDIVTIQPQIDKNGHE